MFMLVSSLPLTTWILVIRSTSSLIFAFYTLSGVRPLLWLPWFVGTSFSKPPLDCTFQRTLCLFLRYSFGFFPSFSRAFLPQLKGFVVFRELFFFSRNLVDCLEFPRPPLAQMNPVFFSFFEDHFQKEVLNPSNNFQASFFPFSFPLFWFPSLSQFPFRFCSSHVGDPSFLFLFFFSRRFPWLHAPLLSSFRFSCKHPFFFLLPKPASPAHTKPVLTPQSLRPFSFFCL